MKIILRGVIAFFIVVSVISITLDVSAAPKKPKLNKTTTTHDLVGEIGYIDHKTISIIYSKDKQRGRESEAVFYLDPAVRVERKNSLDDILIGDQVRVHYRREIDTNELGIQINMKKVATIVRFIRSKPTGLVSD